jgi:transposase
LIQALYGIRSERQLMEQLNYNLLYRWFVGLSPDDPVLDPTTFTKNRERLQAGEVFEKFMTRLLNHPQVKPLLSDEHFSVDGSKRGLLAACRGACKCGISGCHSEARQVSINE